jgi:hypothetical protein
MFGDRRFAALGVHAARLVVPWDAEGADARRADAWLAAAARAGVEPFVAFDRSRSDACPDAPCRLPSVGVYEDQVRAFLSAHPSVRTVTPWNEPNHAAEPTAGDPERAAAYYDAVRRACPSCTLVAGDVIDGGDWTAWLERYRSALSQTPTIWGLHDYYDTTYFQTSGLRTLLDAVPGDVWLTETGGIVSLRTRGGQTSLPPDETRASASVSLALDAARTYASRVRRVYLYQWQSGAGERFDAGLLRPDGSARPAYDAVRAQAAAFASPLTQRPSATSPPVAGLAITGRVTLRASGMASVRVRCPSDAPCHGRLWLEGAAFAAGMLVDGRTPGGVLRPVGAPVDLNAGGRATLRFVVGRPIMSHAVADDALSLRLTMAGAEEGQVGRSIVRVWRPVPAHRR